MNKHTFFSFPILKGPKTKSIKLFAFLILIQSSYLTTIAEPIPPDCLETYSIEGCNCSGNSITKEEQNGVVRFYINCLEDSDLPDCSDDTNCYQFFWDFGDGQYSCGAFFDPDSGKYFIQHPYEQVGNFEPKLIVTKRYTNDDPTDCSSPGNFAKVWDPIPLGTVFMNDPASSSGGAIDHSNCMEVTPIHKAYAGEDVWVVVSFRNMITNSYKIKFYFDPGLFGSFSNNDYEFYPPVGNNSVLTLSPYQGNGELIWEVNPNFLPTDQFYNIFIKLNTNSSSERLGPYNFRAKIDTIIEACGSLEDSYVSLDKVGPKDPNEKNVNISFTNSNQPETLNYNISFYNIGNGPASIVTVKDVLSPKLDYCHFEMKDVIISGKSHKPIDKNDPNFWPDYNATTRTLTWVFNFDSINKALNINNTLPNSQNAPRSLDGLYQDSVGYKNSDSTNLKITKKSDPKYVSLKDPRTRIEILFSIKTNCTFDYGDVIKNEAEVQFDTLEWFITDPARTTKVCCDPTSNTTIQGGDSVDILTLYSGSLDTTTIYPTTASFDAGGILFYTNGYFQYDLNYLGLDRVVFTVCDSSGRCETLERFLCIYPAGSAPFPFTCDNTPCVDIPCPQSCKFLFWTVKYCWMRRALPIVIITVVLFGLFLIFRKRQ